MPNYEYKCTGCGVIREISETIAEMEASRDSKRCIACESPMTKLFSCPTLFTETAFFSKRGEDDGFAKDERGRRMAKSIAQRAGVSTAGKVFMPSLCRQGRVFDPQAWVGDTSDIRRAANAANVNVKGSCVNVQQPPMATEMRPYRVADDIVERKVDETIEKQHGGIVDGKTRQKLRQTVREQITPTNAPLVPHEVVA
jgi:putative FmdB family regulatory protein